MPYLGPDSSRPDKVGFPLLPPLEVCLMGEVAGDRLNEESSIILKAGN